jgi:hypothetical protein
VQLTLLKAATFSLFFLPLVAASVHAQAPPSTRPDAQSPLSEIARDFSTWLSHLTGSGATHHQAASSPPLPRPTGGTDARIRGAQQGAGGTCACTHNPQKENTGACSDKRLRKAPGSSMCDGLT